jgi:hypothetical protein
VVGSPACRRDKQTFTPAAFAPENSGAGEGI